MMKDEYNLMRVIGHITTELSYCRIDSVIIDEDSYLYTVDEGEKQHCWFDELTDKDIETIKKICEIIELPITIEEKQGGC